MFRSVYTRVGAVVGTVGAALVAPLAHAQYDTSTLTANINSVSDSFVSYFTVLLTTFWPLVVGIGILAIVWGFARGALNRFH